MKDQKEGIEINSVENSPNLLEVRVESSGTLPKQRKLLSSMMVSSERSLDYTPSNFNVVKIFNSDQLQINTMDLSRNLLNHPISPKARITSEPQVSTMHNSE
jgi:hypothetical protein